MKQKVEARRKSTQAQRLGAELVGTFLLTFVAAGADIIDSITPPGTIGHVARYMAPALTVMALIWSLSAISGAHINPVVTLAFWVRRSFPTHRVPGYLAAQFLGATGAAWLLQRLFGAAIEHGANRHSQAFSDVQALSMEAVLTFVLVYVILATAEEAAVVGKNAAIAVAGVVALCGLAFSPVSGASMNPARSFGPALVSGGLHSVWIYFIGPMIGALMAAATAYVLHGPPDEGELDAARGKG